MSTWEKCDTSWAGRFLELAVSETRRIEITSVFRNVTVIDFNYDRVRPQYLFSALRRNFGLYEHKAAECIAGLRIVHPYGWIGYLDWLSADNTVSFGASEYDLNEIADRLKTYTEERNDPEMRKIREVIDDAEVLIVLGFGFHKQNVRLLNAASATGIGKHLFMTMKGIEKENHETIIGQMIDPLKNCVRTRRMTQDTCSEFLRRLRPSIQAAVS